MALPAKEHLSRKEAAAYLRTCGLPLSPATLKNMAVRGNGPPYDRFLYRIVVYAKADLDEWLAANRTRCPASTRAA